MAIYLGSDWHILKYDKQSGNVIVNRKGLEAYGNQIKTVQDDDQFIFLGDMFDSEITSLDTRIVLLPRLKGKNNIFIRGNNDVMSDAFYKSLGFSEVLYGKIIEHGKEIILLSHTSYPVTGTNVTTNIHGHIHRDDTDCDDIAYYHSPWNNINICNRIYETFDINDIDISKEKGRNNLIMTGKEKPGMSAFIQNKLTDVIYDWKVEKGIW